MSCNITVLECMSRVCFWPVGREDVQRWRLFAQLVRLLHRDGQRLTLKQLLVLDRGAAESLPHRDVLKRHWNTHTLYQTSTHQEVSVTQITDPSTDCICIFSHGDCTYDLCILKVNKADFDQIKTTIIDANSQSVSSQVTFISIAPYTILIVSKQRLML